MTAAVGISIDPRETRAQAAGYGLIAACFRYADGPWLADLKNPAHWNDWPDWLNGGPAAHSALVALRDWALAAGPAELAEAERGHARLFGHCVRGSCPPYELEYGTDEIVQRASELADIAGFYSAFGLQLGGRGAERVDHVSAECEFMSALAEKLAYAAQADDLEESEICVAAQRKFLRCHLGCWLPAFTQRLIDDGPGFHHVAAGFTALFIEAECRRLDVPHGSPYLQLRRVDQENESAQACGKEVCGVPAAPFTPLTIGQT